VRASLYDVLPSAKTQPWRRKRPRAQRIHSHVHGARVCELSVGLAVVAVLVRDPRAYSVCVRADDIVTIVSRLTFRLSIQVSCVLQPYCESSVPCVDVRLRDMKL
jgi:hypothetical protein